MQLQYCRLIRVGLILVVGMLSLLASIQYAQPTRPESLPPVDGSYTPPVITITAVGDIMLSRGVGGKIARKGIDYPFAYARQIIPKSDVTFANLESPISNRGRALRKPYVFRAYPRSLGGLEKAGFNILSLANNHSLDWGRSALSDTMERLDKAGIIYAGAGANVSAARQPGIIDVKGTRIAFLAYCDLFPKSYYADTNVVSIAPMDENTLPIDISEALKQADVVVVSFHWGNEYQFHSTKRQQMLGHLAVDSGADLVLGHHPHVLQEIEIYKGRIIAYSLGNFIFDQRDSYTKESAVLQVRVTLGRSSVLDIVPIEIARYQPRPASKAVTARVLSRLSTTDPRPEESRELVVSGE